MRNWKVLSEITFQLQSFSFGRWPRPSALSLEACDDLFLLRRLW
jgi:hypothetical protein